jgi:hypothetical protein
VSGPRQWQPTPGPWSVAQGLTGEHARHNGLVVVAAGNVAVADCENDALPLGETRSNARAVAALPEIIEALRAAEDHIGDQPRSPDADRVYRQIASALALLRHSAKAPPWSEGGRA